MNQLTVTRRKNGDSGCMRAAGPRVTTQSLITMKYIQQQLLLFCLFMCGWILFVCIAEAGLILLSLLHATLSYWAAIIIGSLQFYVVMRNTNGKRIYP